MKTTNQSCASILRFALGDAAHLRTYRRSDGRISFEFHDPDDKGADLALAFFSPEGAGVANAKEFLAVDRAVRQTVGIAMNSVDQEWENPGI